MESESNTRKRRIHPRLTAAGWTVTPFDPSMLTAIPAEKAVEEWPTEIGPADSRDVVFVLAACGDGR